MVLLVFVVLKIMACGGRNARLKVTGCVADDGVVLLSSPEKVAESLELMTETKVMPRWC